ncbi:transposase, MuDR, MULE transposase domain protein [Tanacetum coccineum]
MDLALQFDNACTAKDDLRKTYEKCNDIPQESRALIDTFLKEESDKDYEMNLFMYGNATKIERQMNAKLVWLREKYNYCSQTHMGGSSSQTHEIGDGYLTEKELHQLHLDKEALRETLEEEARAEKEWEERIKQKQTDDELFMLKFGVKYDSEYEAVMSTQEYMKKVVEDVGKDEDFKSGSWVSATDYVNANGGIVSGCLGDIKNFLNNGKLDQVVAIVKSCSPNVIGDLTMTMKDLSCIIPGTIHHKVVNEGGYGKDISVGDALILANVLVFSPKPSMHYLNITKRNVVKVFRKDTVPESCSG